MAAKARPYKDFLSPFTHRQFTSAAILTLGLCYAEAVWMGEWDNFIWMWFPIGRAGMRAILLFISYLIILMLCVSHIHIGARTTDSQFDTFRQYLFRFNTLSTIICYAFSAWWYSEVYMWCRPHSDNLGWVDHGKTYERPRLNERPLYVYVMFFQLALLQSAVHLYRDYGRVQLPTTKLAPKADEGASIPARQRVIKRLLPMVNTILPILMGYIVVANILYFVVFRKMAWNIAYPVIRLVSPSIPKNSKPRAFNFIGLTGRVFVQSILLTFLWEFTNTAFSVYLAQEPLKNGKPITDDSKDPNGSLLIGLKAKRDMPRNMAFWELALISQRFPERRKTIYTELNLAGSGIATWKSVLEACLLEITSIKSRIDSLTAPPPPAETMTPEQRAEMESKMLKRISGAAVKTDDVFVAEEAPATELERGVGQFADFAKRRGQHPGADPLSPVREGGKRLIEYGGKRLLSDEHRKQLEPNSLMGIVQVWFVKLVASPVGGPFRQTFARRVTAAVLGTPYSHTGAVINAIVATTELALNSIKEDDFGIVSRDIAVIIRAFADAIKSIEAFVTAQEPHWTDIAFRERHRRVEDVHEVLLTLRVGLTRIVDKFGNYLAGMDMGIREVKDVKELIAARGPEMQEA
ncbi:uncharacterized protein K452DRAFT_358201 [Aplosporella prunicola CBS 121167]|uniref:Nucleoporin NDC1 n=1 Tax=Aplosporella prunicola CBS 121167 TaxID=1176127 RepID=A0A6A6BEB5_9PEZI|nr:uncharacterized protein K452DRAFT_358201 [Aplosporella prunicola CBS 121167]KAF2142396.1 hypothetical protein K452DRAFT_358201 [Aplosporella prunicola CBS 121167]